jgi:hypothetical protein
MRTAFLTFVASLGLVACGGPSSHRSPRFSEAPKKTLFTSAVPCLEAVEVASGGEVVRRATGFGPLAVQRLNTHLARRGAATPAVPTSFCIDFTSDQAADPRDFKNPPAPPVLRELAEMTGADSVLVPVVASTFRCDKTTWRWGEPAYEHESGRIDCHEDTLVYAAFLYAADGALLWKAVHRYELKEPPELAELAETLLFEAPLGEAARFQQPKSPDDLDALDDIPEEEEVAPPPSEPLPEE